MPKAGYQKWRDRYRYGHRWDSEGNLSAVKRLTGDHIMASEKPNVPRSKAKIPILQLNYKIQHSRRSTREWKTVE
jgi:hypothetical protein